MCVDQEEEVETMNIQYRIVFQLLVVNICKGCGQDYTNWAELIQG